MSSAVVNAFVSAVMVVRDEGNTVRASVGDLRERLSRCAKDFEIVIVDNGSKDETVNQLRELVRGSGWPNLQVFTLAMKVDDDAAMWAGVEHALGDHVVTVDHRLDDYSVLPEMLALAAGGADVVLASGYRRTRRRPIQRLAYAAFRSVYKWSSGLDIKTDLARFRVLSRAVVSFLMRQPCPADSYRFLPVSSGFVTRHVDSQEAVGRSGSSRERTLLDEMSRGLTMLVASSDQPMRVVCALSLFGAAANLAYSAYVVAIALFKNHVAAGWVSTSLQASGMFFLMSVALFFIGEYILKSARASSGAPQYVVAQEFASEKRHYQRLNVEAGDEGVVTPLRRRIA